MVRARLLLLPLVLLLNPAALLEVGAAKEYSRQDFPADFVFGSGTAAYQVEGAASEDGRTPSIFDAFAHSRIWHYGTGDVACDEYHKYKEDVQLMLDTGLDAYRFSISWSRLIPNGRGPVNPKGLEYYNNLIDELVSHGIQPHVTLLHLDVPQALEDEYGGLLNKRIMKDFTDYADVCFREFGDRVLHWTTVNECNLFAMGGYDIGLTPPRRCSAPFSLDCDKGNSTTEPYIAAHNILLAHASAVRLYKRKYQAKQQGYIGLDLLAYNAVPLTNSTADRMASQRANDFFMGWFMDPLIYGDYPEIMKRNAGKRIPEFTESESKLVKGTYDFIGVNHYFSPRVKDNPSSLESELRDYIADMAISMSFGTDYAPKGGFSLTPWTMQGTLEYFKQVYGNPPIYIYENGQRERRNVTLNNVPTVEFLRGFVGSVLDAIRNGSNTRGYFTWSFLDLFEPLDGYSSAFGLYYVDLDDPNLTRYPKLSQRWYSAFLKRKAWSSDDIQALNSSTSLSQGYFSQ